MDAFDDSFAADIHRTTPAAFDTTTALAAAFGAPVFVPDQWPSDVVEVSYRLARSRLWKHYEISASRQGGRPVLLIGEVENPTARLPDERWYEPVSLEALSGKVAQSEAGYRAVLRCEQQVVQLLGFATESELIQSALSIKRVSS